MSAAAFDAKEAALLALLQRLSAQDYRFVTPTPLTHSRVIARDERRTARSLSDVFGWSLPFAPEVVGAEILGLLRAADMVTERNGALRCTIRVSSIGDQLYLHTAYPTAAVDAVFFGPDTYRYCSFVAAELDKLPRWQAPRVIDVGCGAGAGGLVAARHLRQPQLLLSDINPAALRFARINAAAAGIRSDTLLSDVLSAAPGTLDLVISNPPYLNDDQRRAYRHGGGALGSDLSLRIAAQALARLRPGGALLLYTGVAIVDGRDHFLQALQTLFAQAPYDWSYRELDPDVFGEELLRPAYREADRIAAVGLVALRHSA